MEPVDSHAHAQAETTGRLIHFFVSSLIAQGHQALDIQNALLSYATGPEMEQLMGKAHFEEQTAVMSPLGLSSLEGQEWGLGGGEWTSDLGRALYDGIMGLPVGDEEPLSFQEIFEADAPLSLTGTAIHLHHNCDFEGTHRGELCSQSCCLRESYREKKDAVFISRCGQPISLIMTPPTLSGEDTNVPPPIVTVELVNPDGTPLSAQDLGAMMLKCEDKEGTKLEVTPDSLNSLKIIGHSSKRGDVSLCPKVCVRVSVMGAGGICRGSLLTQSFVVTSIQSDHPKSFYDPIVEHQPAKRVKGIGLSNEWAKKTVGELRTFLGQGGKLRDQRSQSLAAEHLRFWPVPVPIS